MKCSQKHSQETPTFLSLLFYLFPVQGSLLTYILLAFLYGCTPETYLFSGEKPVGIKLSSISGEMIESIDIFVFNDDLFQRIDAYQSFTGPGVGMLNVASSGGKKIMFLCANSHKKEYSWEDISSYNSLGSLTGCLEYERKDYPLMTGEINVNVNESSYEKVEVQPLACEVILRSISCDLSKTRYSGCTLDDVKVYLINVCAECPVNHEGSLPVRIINSGSLNEDDMKKFREPDLLLCKLPEKIGEQPLQTDIHLRCYPNSSVKESPGSPFTRLVIEGRIDGTTYYFPIDINDGKGMSRNSRFIYDLQIMNTGVDNPDMPVRRENIDIKMQIQPWDIQEIYNVDF